MPWGGPALALCAGGRYHTGFFRAHLDWYRAASHESAPSDESPHTARLGPEGAEILLSFGTASSASEFSRSEFWRCRGLARRRRAAGPIADRSEAAHVEGDYVVDAERLPGDEGLAVRPADEGAVVGRVRPELLP